MTNLLVHYVVEYLTITSSTQEMKVGDRYLFDSQNCITIFKKLANLQGHGFGSTSADKQYVYDFHLCY
jgi:hypothetical protein